ncbi:hypothetical protein CHS0354_011600 [Potamilus streckersoni]|uniref:Uncharacterized protein n=1 Tax=Potamilus streckersoni TaxID=2493646 RepID=A0AAE0TAX7_9BIVA|nr:hypothetical protein CHS0354_011600 [Potamilus streckersoni]
MNEVVFKADAVLVLDIMAQLVPLRTNNTECMMHDTRFNDARLCEQEHFGVYKRLAVAVGECSAKEKPELGASTATGNEPFTAVNFANAAVGS